MLFDLEKQKREVGNNSRVVELETMKKQAEDNLNRIANQARQCHEKLTRKIANLEALMNHAKRGENAMLNKLDETKRLQRTSLLDVEKLTKMQEEYEKKLAEIEAEKNKLKEQMDFKLAEIEQLKDSIESGKVNLQKNEELVQNIANLKDEKEKLSTKIKNLKEALEKKRKECKVIF